MSDGRIAVRKMYKLYIGGSFVRSESGRSDPLWDGKEFGANVARASRKDVRDAVVAARAAQAGWWKLAPAARGLILYRLAEMLESRKTQFPRDQIDSTIDRIVWYAGWCDKYAALLSSRNPVGGPHFNFSTVEPMGVVGVAAPDEPALLALASVVIPAIVAGNTVVVIASHSDPRTCMDFAEALATSDVPGGVINILTGIRTEIVPVLAQHMDVQAMAFDDTDTHLAKQLQEAASSNVKRVRVFPHRSAKDWCSPHAQSLDDIAAYCEVKTIWHPAGV